MRSQETKKFKVGDKVWYKKWEGDEIKRVAGVIEEALECVCFGMRDGEMTYGVRVVRETPDELDSYWGYENDFEPRF